MDNTVNLEKAMGYIFQNKELLDTALTHSSYANETKKGTLYNERQEFLGDAVLSIVVSDYLFNRFHLAEGDLTKLRAGLVCEKSLAGFAKKIDLGKYLRLGKGEEQMGGRERVSILADAFEAIIAAVYLDNGIKSATDFVIPFVSQALDDEKANLNDYKTTLQEVVQKNPEEKLGYNLVDETGPDHDKCFEVEVLLNSNVIGRGNGKSKKAAEQMAAKEALKLMGL